ncbi:hypothetical protein ILYODFUR_014411 [Ilyodon furcidens]|uniref:Uncharacterized protein n=1 Tax=Ilyodon furcidens TaxID=33524 RepID=A0ABV0UVD6_9TELE
MMQDMRVQNKTKFQKKRKPGRQPLNNQLTELDMTKVKEVEAADCMISCMSSTALRINLLFHKPKAILINRLIVRDLLLLTLQNFTLKMQTLPSTCVVPQRSVLLSHLFFILILHLDHLRIICTLT